MSQTIDNYLDHNRVISTSFYLCGVFSTLLVWTVWGERCSGLGSNLD